MRVLVLTSDTREKGGLGNYYRCLQLNMNPNIDYFFVNRATTTSILSPNKSTRILVLKKLINLVQIYFSFFVCSLRYQIIHINPSMSAKSFYRDMIFIIFSRLARKKIIVFFRGWEDEYEAKIANSYFLSFLFKYSFARADRFIVLGRIFKEKLISLGVNPSTPFHIETTVADSRYIEHLDIEQKTNIFSEQVNFLFISRILKQKGIYIAIDAFANCCERHTDRNLVFNIAGEGEELDKAKAYTEKRGYTNITFLGNVSGDEKKELLLKSHIMIFPTYHGEGLPNCLLEGMLYGMAIISRNTAGIPDIVTHNVNGYLTDSLDSDVFTRLCEKIITDPAFYKTIAIENHRTGLERFSTEKVKKRILDIYNVCELES